MDLKRQKINILGVNVDDISQSTAVECILRLAEGRDRGHFVATVNSEFIMLARKDKEFAHVLLRADLAVADGWWVAFSKLILGGKYHQRITGVDLVGKLCRESSEKVIAVGFLGGFGSVAEMVAKRQKAANRQLRVVFAGSGDPAIGYDLRLKKTLDKAGRVDILFVAYGMGQQEFWIERNRNKLNVGVYIGVGGAFDYLAGVKIRAPKWVQNAGFEWLFRLVLEPHRLWRMRVLPIFFGLIVMEKLRRLVNRPIS